MRLSRRQLNRSTLQRQLLLDRTSVNAIAAVAQIAGLQAQEPATPYVALWARVKDLDAAQVDVALLDHALVKATLQRSTLHIVTATDYPSFVAALTTVLRSKWMGERRGRPVNRGLPELADASLAYAQTGRSNLEMRDHAASLGEPVSGDELWRRIRRYAPFIQVPTGEPWSFGRRPTHIAANAWLEHESTEIEQALEHLVRAYLSAFGPARLADISQWSGLPIARLRIGLDRIDGVVPYVDEDGRHLHDLPGMTLPDATTSAPPRLLPMWDETLLAYKDRSRVLPERYRKHVIVKTGDVLPTFTVDGEVAGLWWAELESSRTPRIVLEPFESIPSEARDALNMECQALARFIADREPDVYQRYRRTARRR